MTCHSAPTTTDYSYFVVMIDYGRKGREAIVDPELTRREVIARIKSREYDRINFVHHIHADGWEDVTNELLKEAGLYEEEHMALQPYISTFAKKYAPGNFVLSDRRVGVTRAIADPTEANPIVLVKWMDDLSEEWVRSEYLDIDREPRTAAGSLD